LFGIIVKFSFLSLNYTGFFIPEATILTRSRLIRAMMNCTDSGICQRNLLVQIKCLLMLVQVRQFVRVLLSFALELQLTKPLTIHLPQSLFSTGFNINVDILSVS
jgi:hypothetical protein